MEDLLGIRPAADIQKNLNALGVSNRSALAATRRLTKIDAKNLGGMLPEGSAGPLVKTIATPTVSADMLLKAAFIPLAINSTAAELSFGRLHGLLHQSPTPGETIRFAGQLATTGKAVMSGPTDLELVSKRAGVCLLKLILDVTVTVYKNSTKQKNLSSTSFGATEYLDVDVVQGTVTSVDEETNCFVHIILKFAIYINQAKLDTKWTEANKKVKRERESAKPAKQTEFAKVPYEFVLMHEEAHVNEASTKMNGIAQNFLRCDNVNVEALRNALKAFWDAEVKLGANIQGPTEERIRRKTWERWDQRKP